MPSDWASTSIADVVARSGLACACSFVFAVLLAPTCILWLRQRCGEEIKSASAELERRHRAKQGTPTMGGLLIVGCFLAALLLCADPISPTTLLIAGTAAALCALGCTDDWIKLRTTRRGLSARSKLLAQLMIALAAGSLLFVRYMHTGELPKLHVPLLGSLSMGWWFVPWVALVVVGSSNAVNLTDGLDGLAGGCMLLAVVALTLLALVNGRDTLPAETLAGVTMAGAALAGALAAFLWFNVHPAKVFMGDAGSLPLGGVLGLLAVLARQEVVLIVVGGVFVVEALSVIVQVASFRTTGRRVFRCAPLHHHFQFGGASERSIVRGFWLAGGLCAVGGVALAFIAANPAAISTSNRAEPVAAGPQTLPTAAGQEMPAHQRTISMRSVSK